MKNKRLIASRISKRRSILAMGLGSILGIASLQAATTTIFTEDFESYTGAATSLEDTATADPTGPQLIVTDDTPIGATEAGTGIQLVNFLASSGSQSLLVRSGSEAQIHIQQPRSGSTYQLDFKLNTQKGEGDRNFYIIARAMGSDTNGEDFMAYRSDRAAGNAIFYYDGIRPEFGWVGTGATHTDGEWQHHRFIFNMRTLTFDLYIDDMTTPVVTGGEISRSSAAVPTMIRIINEGNSEDDGYFAIDDVTLTVEDSVDLATEFTEGFEDYPAAEPFTLDNANPLGPWITNESDGTGDAPVNPAKVQVVDADTVAPHSGTKSLKIEGGQRAGVTFAWGSMPQQDVQVTWWARVPASVAGTPGNYLRMSLYGLEDGKADGGDSALLGYGSRDATIGDETSLTIYTTAWVDTLADYTPDTWEQYRLTTHVDQGTYTIVKNPGSENEVMVADRAPFVGSAATWGPHWMIGFSSSNGTGHPPVYVDDIEVVSLTTSVDPVPDPYEVSIEGTRFSNVTTLKINGPAGNMAVDPRDNSTIYFLVDAAPGGIYRATKTSAGNWSVDEEPIVAGIDRPSGITIDANGTLWWVHDYGGDLMRLKAPYESNTPEMIISNFGPTDADDDPIDVTITPANFANNPNWIVVADRGTDGDNDNSIYLVDPATTELDQLTYENYLVPPSAATIGSANLNAITAVPTSGEVAVINADALIYLVDGNGSVRAILPKIYEDPFVTIQPSAIAADPTTGRIWLADNVFKEVWSISTEVEPDAEVKELDFTLKEGSRPDSNISFHDPGLAFSPDGSILVVSDQSTGNGGGRLHIFHNEEPQAEVTITSTEKTAQGFTMEWAGVAGATYQVQRATDIEGTFENISGVLTESSYTDATAPAGNAFYRVVVLE